MTRQVVLFAGAFVPVCLLRLLGAEVEAVSLSAHIVWLAYISIAPYMELLSILKTRKKVR